MYSTAYNLWTFTWFVHLELPFRLKGTEKIYTERFSKFHSNIYAILFGYNAKCYYENMLSCKMLPRQNVTMQNVTMQNLTMQNVTMQNVATQNVTNRDVIFLICKQWG